MEHTEGESRELFANVGFRKAQGTVNGVPCASAPIDTSAAILTPSGNTYFDVNGRRVVGNFLECNDAPRVGSGCTTGNRGSAAVDVINFHCYVWSGNPDDVVGYVRASRALLSEGDLQKPFFCDEGGWATNSTFPDPDLEAGFVARWFIDLFSEGVTTAIWYSWDDQFWGTLWARQNYNGCTVPTGCLTKAGVAYAQVNQWLSGSTVESCQVSGGVTQCSISRPDGFSGLLVWVNTTLTTCADQEHPDVCGSTIYDVPPGYTTKATLDGTVQPANAVEYIGAKPILLSNF